MSLAKFFKWSFTFTFIAGMFLFWLTSSVIACPTHFLSGPASGITTALNSFKTTYGKYPNTTSGLLENSKENEHKIEFLDKMPKDIYNNESDLKIIYNVKTAELIPDLPYSISKYKTDPSAKGMILYSVGKNEKEDYGIHDPKNGKDDISAFIEIDQKTGRYKCSH